MTYTLPWWMPNKHAQTILPNRLRRSPPPGQWHSFKSRDGDTLEYKALDHGGPLVLILHGLGGCGESPYVMGMQRHLNQAGFSTWAWNARGAVAPNQSARTYHGGCYADVQDLIDQAGDREVYAIGFSLGAAMLLNAIGRDARGIRAAVTISCPFGFVDNVRHLDGPKGAIYRRYLIGRLQRMAQRKRQHGLAIGAEWAADYPQDQELASLTTFQAFDDRLTGPLNGFDNAMDLYEQVDPAQVFSTIETPLLMLQADDDPFFTPDSRPPRPLPKSCQFELTRGGGHVGFVSGLWPWTAKYYAEHRALTFLLQHCEDLR